MDIERLPCALQQHGVAGLQNYPGILAGAVSGNLGSATLHGQDDQVPAIGDHAGKDLFADKA